MAKEFLSKENVEFTEFNVMEDREALKEMTAVSGVRTVPVTTGCDKVVVGFNKDELTEIIKCVKS
ncbi:glutaredoxin family protein [Thermodesulfobacteriota bacterium]